MNEDDLPEIEETTLEDLEEEGLDFWDCWD